MPEELGDEEGVAVGLARDLLGERDPGVVHPVPGGGLHDRHHVGAPEPRERHSLHALLTAQGGQDVGEGMLAVELGVAEGPEDDQSGNGGLHHDVPEQRERLHVRPVEIVEDEHHGRGLGSLLEEAENGAEEQVALGLGVAAAGPGRVREAPAPGPGAAA